ncbi:unnamed protein product, partial [Ixodes persulcatus]
NNKNIPTARYRSTSPKRSDAGCSRDEEQRSRAGFFRHLGFGRRVAAASGRTWGLLARWFGPRNATPRPSASECGQRGSARSARSTPRTQRVGALGGASAGTHQTTPKAPYPMGLSG